MRQSVRLAARLLARDWRAGELRLLALALAVAVAAISSVGFFTQRVRLGLQAQASTVLGGDLALVGPHPVSAAVEQAAHRAGLRTTRTLSFPSVVQHGDQRALATVRAVGPAWPLTGRVGIASTPFGPASQVDHGPAPGDVWLDARLISLLHLRVGDILTLGRARLTVTRALVYEPDRSTGFASLAPHLLLNQADIAATGLVQPASRVRYRFLVAGAPVAVDAFRRHIAASLDPATRLEQPGDAHRRLGTALARGRQFLDLAALVSVILSGIAVAASARQHMRRQLDSAALLRCLGAPARLVTSAYVIQLGGVGLLASLCGCAIGYGAQYGLVRLLGTLLGTRLPAGGWAPAGTGLATGILLLLGFALPALLRVGRVPPARAFRRDLGNPGPPSVTAYAAALVTVAALLWWHTADAALTLQVFVGVAATCGVLAVAGLSLLGLLQKLRTRVGISWRFGLAAIARRRGESVIQLVGFGLGIMVLLLLSLIRSDLMAGWQASIPARAPNQFLINIQPDQRRPLAAFLRAHGVAPPRIYPMVRARLVAHNGRRITARTYSDPQARHLAEREFNLSWAAHPQRDNTIVAGHWWSRQEYGEPLLSVEQRFAERLGLRVGDTLRFYIAGRYLRLRVANLRKVEWDSFRVNFFTVTPPGVLEGFPATYITSFYLPPARGPLLTTLMKRFPNVSVIDVRAILDQVKEVISRVSMGVQYVFGFTLLAGILVLLTAVQATRPERRYESAMLRMLGARRRTVLAGIAAEFVLLGALAGLIGALAAVTAGHVLADQLFHIPYHADPRVLLAGVLGGAAGVGLAGVLATRSVLSRPPLDTLREHERQP